MKQKYNIGPHTLEEHKKIAETYFDEKIKGDDEVIGVVQLGAGARGHTIDEYSDIDLIVFVSNPTSIYNGIHEFGSYLVDTKVREYEKEYKLPWNQTKRRAYTQRIILYDRRGMVEKLLTEKLVFPEKERTDIIVENVFKVGHINRRINSWGGRKYFWDPVKRWTRRNNPINAHFELNSIVDSLLNIMYAYDREFIPDIKWKFMYLPGLTMYSSKMKILLDEITLIKEITFKDYQRRLECLDKILEIMIPKLEEDKFLPDNIFEYYLREFKR